MNNKYFQIRLSSLKYFLILIFCITTAEVHSKLLLPSHVRVIGVNGDANPFELTIFVYSFVYPHSIKITDRSWDATNSKFINSPMDGEIIWDNAYTGIYKITITPGPSPTITGLPGTFSVSGWSSGVVNTDGDSWVINDLVSSSGFYDTAFSNWSSNDTGLNNWLPNNQIPYGELSNRPPILYDVCYNTFNGNSISSPTPNTPHFDNLIYTGPLNGELGIIIDAMNNRNNWSGNETEVFDLNPGGANFPSFIGIGQQSVKLSNFKVSNIDNYNHITWETDSEINNKSFEIERSTNSKIFTKIGSINGLLKSENKTKYEYNDFSFEEGNNYYRLKQVDLDGKFEYSKIISTLNETKNLPYIYPNPSEKFIKINSELDIKQFEVIDTKGRTLITSKINLEKTIDISDLQKGEYILKLDSKSFKFVKQ